MKILVLGGTRFFGIPMIEALLKYGHEVTIATRGLQKDPFENRVQRIIADRQNIEDLKKIFEDNHYDLVIDKIAYASNDIKRLLDVISCDRYMLMSTTAVYEYVDTFDPYHDDYLYVNRNDDSYRITKRYAECALAQDYPQIPSVVVRYPFVVGLDDYTKRIQFYINHILLEKSMYIDNLNTPLHFIDSQEAGEFMAFLANENITGIFDGASVGTITIKEMIEIIEKFTGKKAILSDSGDPAPYNDTPYFELNTQPAQDLGYYFSDLSDWMKLLIKQLLITKEKNIYKMDENNYVKFALIHNIPYVYDLHCKENSLLLDLLQEDYTTIVLIVEATNLQDYLQQGYHIIGGYNLENQYYHLLKNKEAV